MVMSGWLSGWAVRTGNKLSRGRLRRRVNRASAPVGVVEIFEARVVMTANPLTAAQAQADVDAAQASLDTAILGYLTAMNGIEGILNGDLQSHAQAFDTSASGAVSGFETSADNIESNADAVLDPIEAQLTTDIDNAEDTYAADEATDLAQFTTDQSTENTNLQTTLDGIDAWLDGQIQIADGTFDGDLATENSTFDAEELMAEGTFNTLVAAEDSTFEASRQSEESGFNSDESGNWNTYEAAVGDATSGATGTYEATVSAYESSRDSQLAAYPNTTYDASVLDPTAVQGVIDAANSAYQSAVGPIMAAYESAIAGREAAYNSATTAAYSTYSSSLATAQQTRDSAYQTADNTRNSAYAAANSAYDTAINGLGGVMDQFNGALQAADNQLATASQAASAAYQSAMETAADVRDAAIDQANQDFTDWISGAGTANAVAREWVKVTHTDNFTVPPTVTWEAGEIYSSPNGDNVSILRAANEEPFAPTGFSLVMVSTVTSGWKTTRTETYAGGGLAAGSRNVFSSAMEARTKEYQNKLDEIDDDYQDEIGPYATTRNNAVQAANDLYLTQLYGNTTGMTPFGVGTPAETFMNAQNGAMQSFSSAESGDWQSFQDATTDFWTNWMASSSSDPMMMTPPDYSILEQLAKDYAVSVANGTITYAQAMASAVTAFMSSERALDSTRDGSVASAEAQYQKDLVNANETASTKSVTAYDGYAKDMLGIDAAYTVAQAGREKTREAKITDAEQTYGLTDNTESETQAKALNKAYRDYNKSVANAWETRTNSTAAADTTRTKAYADADEDHTNDYAGADGDFANDEAGADKTLTKDLGQAEVDREKGIVQDQTSLTSQILSQVTTFVSSVATGIDALYTSYYAGDTDQAAVSGIMTQFSDNAAAAWSALTNAEAGAFQTYINDTMDDWKDQIDTLADDAETRINNLMPGVSTMIGSLASAAKDYTKNMADAAEDWLNSASAASKSADHQAADAAKSSADTIVGYAKTLADASVGNWHTGINSLLDASLTFITNTTNTALPFMQQFVGAVTGLTNSLIGFAATAARNDIDSIKTALVNATTTDDSLFAAWATLMGKQSILFATEMRDSTDATPASTFTYGSRQSSPMMGYYGGVMMSDESYRQIRDLLVDSCVTQSGFASGSPNIDSDGAFILASDNPRMEATMRALYELGARGPSTTPVVTQQQTDQARLNYLHNVMKWIHFVTANYNGGSTLRSLENADANFPRGFSPSKGQGYKYNEAVWLVVAQKLKYAWTAYPKVGLFGVDIGEPWGNYIPGLQKSVATNLMGNPGFVITRERFESSDIAAVIGTLTHEPQHDASQGGLGGHSNSISDIGSHIRGMPPGTNLEDSISNVVYWLKTAKKPGTNTTLWDAILKLSESGIAPG